MVNRCINPLCKEEMGRLGLGELYSHEIREEAGHIKNTEFFWICPECTSFLTIRLDKQGHPVAVPKAEVVEARWPHSGHDLRLAFFTDSESSHARPRADIQALQRSIDLSLTRAKGEAA